MLVCEWEPAKESFCIRSVYRGLFSCAYSEWSGLVHFTQHGQLVD